MTPLNKHPVCTLYRVCFPTPGPPSQGLIFSTRHNHTAFSVALVSHLGILSSASEFTLWGNLVGSGGCHWTASGTEDSIAYHLHRDEFS